MSRVANNPFQRINRRPINCSSISYICAIPRYSRGDASFLFSCELLELEMVDLFLIFSLVLFQVISASGIGHQTIP
jgi:hypothetical protein